MIERVTEFITQAGPVAATLIGVWGVRAVILAARAHRNPGSDGQKSRESATGPDRNNLDPESP